MANYYPLISKAVGTLDPDSSAESRRIVYERARAALLAQLRAASPPFTEAEITHERLALEEAVRTVEGEAAQRVRDARFPSFSDLVTEADDIGEVPSMIITGGATGRLKGVWRCSIRYR
jgi:hypothetical protein